jgi:hypothetical protein
VKDLNSRVSNLENQKQKVNRIKDASVIVACLSSAYVKDKACLEEFIFAKKSLSKVVIPIVVGPGDFNWMMSVIGQLIGGEKFIHFKERFFEFVLSDLKVFEPYSENWCQNKSHAFSTKILIIFIIQRPFS